MDKPIPEEAGDDRFSDPGKLAAHLYQKPSFSSSSAMRALYAGKRLTNKSPTGFDIVEMTQLLEEQEKAISQGDISRVEEMLVTQAHVLQAIFSTYVTKAASATYLDNLQAFLQLALKAQNQCRQTLSTLADFAKPNRTTYIAQQNNALAQQVNQDVGERKINLPNELLEATENAASERMDGGKETQTVPANKGVEAVGKIYRT